MDAHTAHGAVIFDLNGVFITSAPLSERFSKDFSVPVETFVPVLKDILSIIRKPGAPDAYACWEPYLRSWKVPLDRDEFYVYWFSAEHPNDSMIAYARELKSRGLRIFALSNNFRERTAYYEKHFPFVNDLFDEIYYSWKTGFIKPNPNAYSLILNDHALSAPQCFYFDDVISNVETARALGFNAYSYVEIESVRAVLDTK